MKLRITQDGRSGSIEAEVDGVALSFWWEFGGGDCIAFIDVPTPAQWRVRFPTLAGRRDEILGAIAVEVRDRQCSGARIALDDNAISFRRR